MARVDVQPALLKWARDRANLQQEDLLVKFPKLAEWELGAARPTLRQLEAYARVTLTPLGYLFLSEPPEERLPVPDFRTHRPNAEARPSPNLLDTIQALQRRQNWLRDYLVEEGQTPLPFVRSRQLSDAPTDVAKSIRQTLRIGGGWADRQPNWTEALRALRIAVETVGITVATNSVVGNNTHRKLDKDEFSGFVLVDEFAPFVFINGADWKAAQMFTLAHELAHVWFGESAVFGLSRLQAGAASVEQACDRVAAEFLVPAEELREFWRHARHSDEPFQTVARHFKVSSIVGARRARDLELITPAEFFEFYRAYEQDERRRRADTPPHDQPTFYPTQSMRLGKRFAYAVVDAVREGRLLYRDAYQLVGLWGSTFDRFAHELTASR